MKLFKIQHQFTECIIVFLSLLLTVNDIVFWFDKNSFILKNPFVTTIEEHYSEYSTDDLTGNDELKNVEKIFEKKNYTENPFHNIFLSCELSSRFKKSLQKIWQRLLMYGKYAIFIAV